MAVHALRDPPLSIDFGEMRSYVCEIDFDQHVLSGFVRNSPHLSVNKRWINTPRRVPTVGQCSVAKQVNRRARQAFTSPAVTWNQRAQSERAPCASTLRNARTGKMNVDREVGSASA